MGTIILSALVAHTGWHWMLERADRLRQYQRAVARMECRIRGRLGIYAMAVFVAGLVWWAAPGKRRLVDALPPRVCAAAPGAIMAREVLADDGESVCRSFSCCAAFAQREDLPKAPTDVKPGSITYEDIVYPYPVAYLPLTLYGQDVRMAYMDVPPAGSAQRPHGRSCFTA